MMNIQTPNQEGKSPLNLKITLNGETLFESDNFKSASEFLYILNKAAMIMSGEAQAKVVTKAVKAKGAKKHSKARVYLTDPEKEIILNEAKAGIDYKATALKLGIGSDRVYGYLWMLKNRGEISYIPRSEKPVSEATSTPAI